MRPKKISKPKNWLIFVDANIWLDFYRKDGTEATKQVEALGRHTDRLILTDQVFMEVLKNRQGVIRATMREIKLPDAPSYPPILKDFASAESTKKDIESARGKVKLMQERIRKILESPKAHDPVFRGLCEIFGKDGEYFLKRDAPIRFSVRRLAQKRFFLGYPPRKTSDTSIGDALNWEWIIRCAKECPKKSDVLLVSRDQDFGAIEGSKAFLNDWLQREFAERVGMRRKIVLTARLTDALKKLSEVVTKAEEETEERIISQAVGSSLDDGIAEIFS